MSGMGKMGWPMPNSVQDHRLTGHRYRRWVTTGVFDAMLETLVDLARRETAADMIDSTVVRTHHCAIGLKGGLSEQRNSAGRAAA